MPNIRLNEPMAWSLVLTRVLVCCVNSSAPAASDLQIEQIPCCFSRLPGFPVCHRGVGPHSAYMIYIAYGYEHNQQPSLAIEWDRKKVRLFLFVIIFFVAFHHPNSRLRRIRVPRFVLCSTVHTFPPLNGSVCVLISFVHYMKR